MNPHPTISHLTCRDKSLDLSRLSVMGIVNLSADSFAAVGRARSLTEAVAHAKKMVAAGADMIDVGAEPTNPVNRAQAVSEAEELALLIPLIKVLANEIEVPLSVDTSRPQVMAEAVAAGAHMINDVRALRVPGALAMAATLPVPICLMHMRHLSLPGSHEQIATTAKPSLSVMQEISDFLQERILACETAGIARERLVIDPGIGAGNFGKSAAENIQILRQLSQLSAFGLPVLVGTSRKAFIGEILSAPAEERLIGSLIAAIAIWQGSAQIIRVHDVVETVQALTMAKAILNKNNDVERHKA